MRVEAWLRAAARRLVDADTPHLDVRILARCALGLDDAGLILAADHELGADEIARLEELLERRLHGESVAHIIRVKEFYGVEFSLAPGILVPRPETELLIYLVRQRRAPQRPLRILDLGVGSGIILATLLRLFPLAIGVGVDIDPDALACTRGNLERLGLAARARLIRSNWCAAVRGPFDVIVSNPPYIPLSERDGLAPEVREFENPLALFGGDDGLDAYRCIFNAAPDRLAGDGLMAVEFGAGQEEAVSGLARRAFPDAQISTENDLSGRRRALLVDCASPPAAQKTL